MLILIIFPSYILRACVGIPATFCE